jgi:NADH-quinone oxidoreductase subunit C
MEHKAIYDLLAERIGAGAPAFHEDPIEPWAEVKVASIVEACTFLRDDPRLECDQFTIRVRMPRAENTVPTVSGVWPTAAWHEREAWDLMGIRFSGHPDPRRMLLDEEWVGHPLRKDYQMPDMWSGVPLRGQPYSENPFAPAAAEQDPAGGDTPAEG